MRAAVAWSYELLSAAEKDLFCRLSVFPGSFSLDAAVAVAGRAGTGAAQHLLSLVSKSMVSTAPPDGGRTRYALLETLRQFGAAQLDDVNAEQARADHAAFYLEIAHSAGPEPFGPGLTPWLWRVDLEFENLRAAFAYLQARHERRAELVGALVVLRRYFVARYQRRREGFRLLEGALVDARLAEAPGLMARALATASSLAQSIEVEASAGYAEAGRDLALATGDTAAAALASALLAQVHGLAGLGDEAESEQAMQLARQVGDPVLVVEALLGMAFSLANWSQYSDSRLKARAFLEEVLMTAEKMGDDSFCSTAHGNLSQLSLTEGRPQMARPHVERWVVLMKELGVEGGPKRQADLLLAEGDVRGALAFAKDSFELARRADSPVQIADTSGFAATCAVALEADQVAARLYGFTQMEYERGGFSRRLELDYIVEHGLGTLKSRMGDTEFALALAQGADMTREELADLIGVLAEANAQPSSTSVNG